MSLELRGRVPSGFNSWADYDYWISTGGGQPIAPAPVGGNPGALAQLAANLAAANAAAVAELKARDRQLDATIPDGYYEVQRTLEAREKAIAAAKREEDAMRADPRWRGDSGFASTVIDADTPGVDLTAPYGITPPNVPTFSYAPNPGPYKAPNGAAMPPVKPVPLTPSPSGRIGGYGFDFSWGGGDPAPVLLVAGLVAVAFLVS